MPKPRQQQISLEATPYYHCTSRCVRRAYLCGVDELTGRSYEHRRQWVEDRILLLAEAFTIDVCAYAVMSNHHHVVLHINSAENQRLTDMEVCQRWHSLYKGTPLTLKYLLGETLDNIQWQAVKTKLDIWRVELANISRFMWALNEPIARKANAEDQCNGRFWESRFKSQALLDEKALLACMAYVDLNPVRAKTAETPETSKHTSVKRRIEAINKVDTTHKKIAHQTTSAQKAESNKVEPLKLAHFVGGSREAMPQGLPFQLKDYLELVDVTGRAIREDKPGYINKNIPPILQRLNINATEWLMLATQFERNFRTFVGSIDHLKRAAQILGLKRRPSYKCQREAPLQ